jgi:ankyrin repeat protein
MPTRELPARPNLEHLKNQARSLLRDHVALDASAAQRFVAFGIDAAKPKLADALHVIAREHGFATWPALKVHVESNCEDPMEALTAAVRANSAPLVREVLARHPALKTRLDEPLPNYGFDAPALFAAVNHGNREMIDLLLDAGADINARTRWWAGGFGILDSASRELAEFLISRGAIVDIHAAARLAMTGRVRELLESDPELVHARGGDGQFPLHFASTVEIASILLDAGAAIDATDIDHESTAVQYMVSIRPHRHDVARYLIARGAEADILAASALGDLALVERILNFDPETIRITVSEKYFPKRNPRSGGCIYIFGFGITMTPHMVARQFGHTAVFDLLMQRSAPSVRLVQAAEAGDEAMAQRLIEQHPGMIARLSAAAARRIVGAAARNNTRAVELLLRYGWPPAATLENNQTALHFAAWHGNLAMVQALLGRGAAVNVFETEHGGSPLAWALYGSLHSGERETGDFAGIARALLAVGAAVPAPDKPLEASEEVLEVIRLHTP